ncbi:MAG: Slp family lipoprotein [Candidatus Thiodiazotropha sp. (ex Gloverina cf. vestifex)]|nr:Slp family lipoprotein [Candidatus Thiodiazotropha sp. (ex Gloverina cf. vestifex)]
MKYIALILQAALVFLVLSACSTAPKVAADADRSPTPAEVTTAATSDSGKRLQWGGVIVESRNLADITELQILAYPLKKDGRPDVTASPNGRFLAQHQGYLETVNYAKGRQVTVTGKFSEVRAGEIGDAAYDFPTLTTDELVLWPEASTTKPKPRVNFGFGVGSGGRSWGGVGVGIGF